jgi:myosin-1
MNIIGLTAEEQTQIFRMLATVLWLGNVQYEEMDDGNAKVADTGVTDFIAYLLEVDGALVEKVMTSKTMETQRGGRRGSVYDVPLNPSQAASGRNALAKAIYNNLFEWIVQRINLSMKPRGTVAHQVGILVYSLTSWGFGYATHTMDRTSSASRSSRSVYSPLDSLASEPPAG